MIESQAMLTLWRRHAATCAHRAKGRDYLKCNCPIWADGYVNGKRTLRLSLKTRDMARARKRAVTLESPDSTTYKSVAEATEAFVAHCESEGLRRSTIRKYRNSLNHLEHFAAAESIDSIAELYGTLDGLDRFRAGRGLSQIASGKELQLLRQFGDFCLDRKWTPENAARRIRGPRNIKQNDVEPYTQGEMSAILGACDSFGRGDYERKRARATVLVFRFTAMRAGDVAKLARDQFNWDEAKKCWRVFLRTEKSGKPIYLRVPDALKDALDALPAPRGAAADCKYYFWNGSTSERAAVGILERTMHAVFVKSKVAGGHCHRFRHTLATDLLARGATFEEVADVLGNSAAIVRKHYGKWSQARQDRIDSLMEAYHSGAAMGTLWAHSEKGAVVH